MELNGDILCLNRGVKFIHWLFVLFCYATKKMLCCTECSSSSSTSSSSSLFTTHAIIIIYYYYYGILYPKKSNFDMIGYIIIQKEQTSCCSFVNEKTTQYSAARLDKTRLEQNRTEQTCPKIKKFNSIP